MGPYRPSGRTPLYAAAGVVAVIIVLLLILAATGVLPFFTSGSGNGPRSFSQARSEAQAAANGYSGGPWTLGAAVEAVPSATISIPFNATVGGMNATAPTGCAFTQLARGNVTISGSQNVSGGTSNEWLFLFKSTASSALFVSDNDGTVQLVGTLTGSLCATALGAIAAIPSAVVDSTTAAATVGAAGGYAFLRAHPEANATVEAFGGISFFGATVPAQWTFLYSTCAINLGGATASLFSGEQFSANVSLTTGQLLGTQTSSCGVANVVGGGPPPLGAELALRAPTETSAGNWHWYNFSVVSATSTIPCSALQFSVQNSAGATVALSAATVAVRGISGTTLASYSMSSGVWTFGGSTLVTNADEIDLQTTTDLTAAGDLLIVQGVPPTANGAITVYIP